MTYVMVAMIESSTVLNKILIVVVSKLCNENFPLYVDVSQTVPCKRQHSLKVKIPRKTLFSFSPYSNIPIAFNGKQNKQNDSHYTVRTPKIFNGKESDFRSEAPPEW